MPLRHLLIVSLIATALAPSAALAGSSWCEAPPGSAGVDQYCEAIPTAGGRQTPHSSGSTGSGGSVSKKTAAQLQQGGADGAAVLNLASNANSGSSSSSASHKASGTSGHKRSKHAAATPTSSGPGGGAPKLPSADPVRAVSASVTGGGTVGSGFVWGLVAATVLLGGVWWTGFRRRSTGDPADSSADDSADDS